MYTVYIPTSWISCAGKLDTVYKLKKLGLYTVYHYELESWKLRHRPEILIKNFLMYQCSQAGSFSISPTKNPLAESCAIPDEIANIASCRKPFLRNRGKSGNHTGKAGKIF